MRTLIAAAALAVMLAGPARAASVMTDCRWGATNIKCITTDGISADVKIMHIPEPVDEGEIAAKAARIKKWEDYCKPIYARDLYNVEHYVYAHEGCEFGRDRP